MNRGPTETGRPGAWTLAALLATGLGCTASPGSGPGGCGAPPSGAPAGQANPGPPSSRTETIGSPSGDPYVFSNGDRISRADGTPILRGSAEGQRLEAILQQQRRAGADNAAQKALFQQMTNAPNAAAAEQMLRNAQQRDPNAGTPNVITNTSPGGSSP